MESILLKQKEKAKQAFAKLDLPTFRYGQGLAVNIDIDFEKVFSEIHHSTKNEVNVIADPIVKVSKLSEQDEEFINNYAQKLVPHTANKLIALHYAALQDAMVIIIPKGSLLQQPIFIDTKATAKASAESIIVIVEAGAVATIIESVTSASSAYYKSQIVQVYANPNSQVTFCSLHNGSEETYTFIKKQGEVQSDAKITWLDFIVGNKFTQVDLGTNLTAAGAETKQYQAFFGTGIQQFDIKSDVVHKHSHTRSWMQAKGVLSAKSKAMYRGLVAIEKRSAGCSGHQKSDILLIGDEARCNAIPILEVENDDVSCSHGAAMGQLDEEQLYYLASRGLGQEKAKQMIVYGFLEPIVQKVADEKLKEEVLDLIQRKINNETNNGTSN